MAIAFDASATPAGGTNPSWSHTCTGSNLALIVTAQTGTSSTLTSITYNSVALTKVISQASTSGGIRLEIWYLLAPATGAHTLAITGSVGRAQSVSYTGVKQSGFPDSLANNQFSSVSGNQTVALSVTASGCWAIGTGYNMTADPDSALVITTDRGTAAGNWKNGAAQDSGTTVSTGTVNVGYHYPGGTQDIAIAALAFAPFTGNVNSNFFAFM